MRIVAEIRERVRSLFFRGREDKFMDEELGFHLEMETKKYVDAGMMAREASRRARLRFGQIEQCREDVRAARGISLLERLGKDVQFSVRSLVKRPGFTLNAVLTLALGIGATSAVFSLVDGVLLTPLPYREAERLVLIAATRPDGDPAQQPEDWSSEQWQTWQRDAPSFEAIAIYRWLFSFLVSAEGSEALEGMLVSPNYFAAVGFKARIGRTFQDAETDKAAVILGHDLWQRRFGGNLDVLGKTMLLGRQDTPRTIIGVMPPGVRFLPSPSRANEPNYDVNAPVDFWIPEYPGMMPFNQHMWNAVGRLRPGASPATAQTELGVLASDLAERKADLKSSVPVLQSLEDEVNRGGRRLLLMLLAAAMLVLVIACGNAAVLLLIRGLQRQQEYGIVSALGAGRTALFRQVGVESLLIAVAGGACGVAIAIGIVTLFKVEGGHAIPRLDAVTTGWPLLAFGLSSALLAALLAGLFPALRASRIDPALTIKEGGSRSSAGKSESRFLRAVILVQTALTLTLLVGAGLLIRTMVSLSEVAAGYETGRVLTMSVTAVDGSDWTAFHRRALERVSAIPGVQQAAFAWGVPLTGNSWAREVEIPGLDSSGIENTRVLLPVRAVTQGYFELLELEVIVGRDFRPTDTSDAPGVVIVNQAFAHQFYPGTTPIGRSIRYRGSPSQIVGVVNDARTVALAQAAKPEVYVSLWQNQATSKHLIVRTEGGQPGLATLVQRELRGVSPTVAIENIRTLDAIRAESLAPRRFAMQLLIGFALIALLLTLGGIYGVMSLSVTSRRSELAIRAALGADRRRLQKLVLGEGLRLVAAGVALGLAASAGFARILESLLFETNPADPATFLVVGILFVTLALLATYAPARRAARISAAEALRGG